jgi:hypothetical protein
MENCTKCGVGQFAIEAGAIICTDCLAGKYNDNVMGAACIDCPGGYFASSPASSSCTGCGAGQFSPEAGAAIACETCRKTPDTLYAPSLSTKCTGTNLARLLFIIFVCVSFVFIIGVDEALIYID